MINFNEAAADIYNLKLNYEETRIYLKSWLADELIRAIPQLESLALDAEEDQLLLLERLLGRAAGNRAFKKMLGKKF